MFQTNNPQVTNARVLTALKLAKQAKLRTLVGTSETIRLLLIIFFSFFLFAVLDSNNFLFSSLLLSFSSSSTLSAEEKENRFNEWLGGLIDGDGCFLFSKAGYGSLEIVGHTRDKHSLYQVKQAFGGSIQLRAGNNHLRYRLHNKPGLLRLIESVGAHIRNPVRLSQLNRICVEYNFPLVFAKPLTYNNGWMSGFFDADGSVYINEESAQVFISISQKNKLLLDPLVSLYGGQIYPLRSVEAFK